jgi:hypothetical protein
MSVPQLKRFLQGMMDSPAFQPYFQAWTAMQAAREAAGSEELESDDHHAPDDNRGPDDKPEPEDEDPEGGHLE